jgi:hypothetical protein
MSTYFVKSILQPDEPYLARKACLAAMAAVVIETPFVCVCAGKAQSVPRGESKEGKFCIDNAMLAHLAYFDKNCPQAILEEVLKMDRALQYFQGKMDLIQRDPALRRTYEAYAKAASDWTSGINDAKRQIARSLKSSGMSVAEISKHTGLNIIDIQRL